MALPAHFLDELRARTPLASVIGRRVRLARSGRQWKGCCPFHGEKSPSFYVYEDHYHCFGCGAHGDAIGFVMQSQGAGFMEAVEQLAAEAGLDVPKPTPEAAAAEQKRLDLNTVLEAAAGIFQRRLLMPEGRAALAYLRDRGLVDTTIRRFGLGWSGEGRGALAAELTREGVPEDLLAQTGLLRRDEESGRVSELFFNRVMFPIRDRRGRVISFGGRTLGDGQPKYLNGPETPVFSKRRSLYGLDTAREAVRAGAATVVVEGYMDVIAMAQAGFGGAVAPLGTALTEEQIEELWRLSPSPVLCFDGDAAGQRAARRAAEIALPLVTPSRTIRLMTLPAGEDPDSLIRRDGADAFRTLLDGARGLADALYGMLEPPRPGASPEERAAFQARLEEAAGRIGDATLSREYRQTLRDRYYQESRAQRAPAAAARPRAGNLRRPGGSSTGGFPRRDDRFAMRPALPDAPPPPPADPLAVRRERVRYLTAILINHPALLAQFDHAFGILPMPTPFDRVRDAILDWADQSDVLDSQGLMDHLTISGLTREVEMVFARSPLPLPGCASQDAALDDASAGWREIFGFLNVERLRQERAEAREAFTREMTAENQARLVALTEALGRAESGVIDVPDGVSGADGGKDGLAA